MADPRPRSEDGEPWQIDVGEAALKAMREAGFIARGFRWSSAGKSKTRFTIVGERGAP